MKKLIAFLKKPVTLIVIACLLVTAIVVGIVAFTGGGNGNDTNADSGTVSDTAAGDNTDSGETKTYTVNVVTEGGMALSGVGVYLYTDSTMSELEWFTETDENGTAVFANVAESSDYVVALQKIPTGYDVASYYEVKEETTTLTLSSGVISDGSLDGVSYKLGDVIRDFTVTATDGEEYTISSLLKEKEAVVLNFWYIECPPCVSEFPYLHEAYEEYGDKIALLALNPENKSDSEIADFKSAHGLTFPMAQCPSELKVAMELTAYPTTVVVDRYGVITMIHKASVTSVDPFRSAFAHFSAEDYKQSLVTDIDSLAPVPDDAPVEGSAEAPIELGGITEFDAAIPAGEKLHYNVYKVSGMEMTVTDADAYVIYNGQTVYPENGVISFIVTSADTFTPVELVIGNSDTEDKTFKVTFTNPIGTSANPYPLEMGQFDTAIKADNDQGVYYTFTATEDGTVTVYNVSITENVRFDYILYNLNSYANRTLTSDGITDGNGVASVSVDVKSGDVVTLTVATTPDENNSYLAADVTSFVYFTPVPVQGGDDDKDEPDVPEMTEYSVTVVDEKGKGISGVKIKITNDGAEATVTTDKNGKAKTELPTGAYKVKLTVPTGYTSDKTEFKIKSGSSSLNVTLKTKADTSDGNTSGGNTSGGETKPKTVSYSVTVVDGAGKAQSGVMVKFMKDGKEAASGKTDSSGKLTKTLEEGSYSVTLSGTSKSYDEKSAVVTASKNSIKIVVADKVGTESVTICPSGSGVDCEAIIISAGHAYTELSYGTMSYFIFEPTKSGVYSFTTSNANAKIGYYGSTFFVQAVNVAEDYDEKTNTFTMNVKDSSIGNAFVIGVDAAKDSVGGCVISIVRTGDPILGPADKPWEVYETKASLSKYSVGAGKTLVNFDITAKTDEYDLVYNSTDGYYHLGDENGPVVLVTLGENAQYASLGKAIETTGIGVYYYDNKGNFTHKVRYNECIQEYVNSMDETHGVYPLTEDLMLIYKDYGKYAGWYDSASMTYLFVDNDGNRKQGVNEDIAWMFALCYAQ